MLELFIARVYLTLVFSEGWGSLLVQLCVENKARILTLATAVVSFYQHEVYSFLV